MKPNLRNVNVLIATALIACASLKSEALGWPEFEKAMALTKVADQSIQRLGWKAVQSLLSESAIAKKEITPDIVEQLESDCMAANSNESLETLTFLYTVSKSARFQRLAHFVAGDEKAPEEEKVERKRWYLASLAEITRRDNPADPTGSKTITFAPGDPCLPKGAIVAKDALPLGGICLVPREQQPKTTRLSVREIAKALMELPSAAAGLTPEDTAALRYLSGLYVSSRFSQARNSVSPFDLPALSAVSECSELGDATPLWNIFSRTCTNAFDRYVGETRKNVNFQNVLDRLVGPDWNGNEEATPHPQATVGYEPGVHGRLKKEFADGTKHGLPITLSGGTKWITASTRPRLENDLIAEPSTEMSCQMGCLSKTPVVLEPGTNLSVFALDPNYSSEPRVYVHRYVAPDNFLPLIPLHFGVLKDIYSSRFPRRESILIELTPEAGLTEKTFHPLDLGFAVTGVVWTSRYFLSGVEHNDTTTAYHGVLGYAASVAAALDDNGWFFEQDKNIPVESAAYQTLTKFSLLEEVRTLGAPEIASHASNVAPAKHRQQFLQQAMAGIAYKIFSHYEARLRLQLVALKKDFSHNSNALAQVTRALENFSTLSSEEGGRLLTSAAPDYDSSDPTSGFSARDDLKLALRGAKETLSQAVLETKKAKNLGCHALARMQFSGKGILQKLESSQPVLKLCNIK